MDQGTWKFSFILEMKTNISLPKITSGQAHRCHKSNARMKFSTKDPFQALVGVIWSQQRQDPVCSTFVKTRLAQQSVKHSPSRCSGNISWTSRFVQEHSSASPPGAPGHRDSTAISLLTPQSTSKHHRGMHKQNGPCAVESQRSNSWSLRVPLCSRSARN